MLLQPRDGRAVGRHLAGRDLRLIRPGKERRLDQHQREQAGHGQSTAAQPDRERETHGGQQRRGADQGPVSEPTVQHRR